MIFKFPYLVLWEDSDIHRDVPLFHWLVGHNGVIEIFFVVDIQGSEILVLFRSKLVLDLDSGDIRLRFFMLHFFVQK